MANRHRSSLGRSSLSRSSLSRYAMTRGAFVATSVLLGGVLLTTSACSSSTGTPAPATSSSENSMMGDSMMSHDAAGHDTMADGVGTMMDADIMFLEMMIPHHEQAVEMSKLASTNGASPAVQQLADAIAAAQGPEIEQMQAWLDEAHAPDMMEDGGMAMSGVLTSGQMAALGAARGAEFDRLYLEGMIGHHQGAVQMAQDEIDSGDNPVVIALANKIIAAQTAEIAQMRSLLAS